MDGASRAPPPTKARNDGENEMTHKEERMIFYGNYITGSKNRYGG